MRPFLPMVRSCGTLLVATAALLAGCGGAIAPDKALNQAAATAAGGTLPGSALDRWLMQARIPPSEAVGVTLVSAWINAALLIDAVRRNAPLDDAATVDSAIRQDAARGMFALYMMGRARRLPPITDPQVDSLARLDQLHVFQEIVLHVRSVTDTAAIRKSHDNAIALVARLQAGGDFSAAVKQYSEDSVTRVHNGFLPAVTQAEMPGRLALVWSLQPGSVSPPIAGRDGFHIMRRATSAEARPYLKAWLAPRLAMRADTLFSDSLMRARHVVVAPDARLRLRAIAVEPGNVIDGSPLATWNGGSLTPATVREVVYLLPPDQRLQLTLASDTVAAQFVFDLARNQVLIGAISNDPPPDAAARAALAPKYHVMIDSLRAAVKRMPADLSAADAATRYIDSSIVTRGFLPLPGSLASILRGRSPVQVDHPVVSAIVRGASARWARAHAGDSTAKGRGPAGKGTSAPVP